MTSRVLDVQAGILMAAGADTLIAVHRPHVDGDAALARRRADVPPPDGRRHLRGRTPCSSCSTTPRSPARSSTASSRSSRWLLELPHHGGAHGRVRRRAAPARRRRARRGRPRRLHEFVDDLQVGLGGLHDRLVETYFLSDRSAEAACAMSIHVALEHRTRYRSIAPSASRPHVVRLRPAPHCRTPILAYSLTVEPADHFINWQQDPFGNFVARLVFPEKTTELSITVDLVADLTVINPFDFFLEPEAETHPVRLRARPAARPRPVPRVRPRRARCCGAWLAERRRCPPAGTPHDRLPRRPQPAAAGRHRLHDPHGAGRADAGGHARQRARLVPRQRLAAGADPAATSASPPGSSRATWCSSTSDAEAARRPVRARPPTSPTCTPGPRCTSPAPAGSGSTPRRACSPARATSRWRPRPHPASAAPVTGATEPCEVTFDFSNTVTRVHEDPRVTLPYTDEQWARDRRARPRGRRSAWSPATCASPMGGEPTFVSIDDMDAAEWTIGADGDDKREHGVAAHRPAGRGGSRPAGCVHAGQGKWYPGEPLPRWQLGLHWRTDGEPLWSRPRRCSPTRSSPATATLADAEALAAALAGRLGAARRLRAPGLRGPARRPAGRGPHARRRAAGRRRRPRPTRAVADEAGRAGGGRRLDARRRRAGRPGSCRCTTCAPTAGGWATSRVAAAPRPPGAAARRLARRPAPAARLAHLDARAARARALAVRGARARCRCPTPARRSTPWPARPPSCRVEDAPPTALGVELRDGRVHVFLPPLTALRGRRRAARRHRGRGRRAAGVPVVIEGYPPPRDPRHRTLVVTPDPGVIEVNVQPAPLVGGAGRDHRGALRGGPRSRGSAPRSSSSTAPTPAPAAATTSRSAAPRRPTARCCAGPTCCAAWSPTGSTTRRCRTCSPAASSARPARRRASTRPATRRSTSSRSRSARSTALGDRRAARGSSTGSSATCSSTSPATPTAPSSASTSSSPPRRERGRLGLLELRGFEMPPHPADGARAGAAGALARRPVLGRPATRPASCAGAPSCTTASCCRTRSPTDIAEVVADLRRPRHRLRAAGSTRSSSSASPASARSRSQGVRIELRGAIEPWHVLGEEVTASGTSRYVDSSVERLQVRVDGARPRPPRRHVQRPRGAAAGHRRRPARRSPACATGPGSRPRALHPTIAVHSPAASSTSSTWRRPVARRLHLPRRATPAAATTTASRSTPTRPTPAGRPVRARSGHTPGPVDVAGLESELVRLDGYPRTLDLRRPGDAGPRRRRSAPRTDVATDPAP